MGKGWGKRSKGRSKVKAQREAADTRAAAEELARLAQQRKRNADDNGTTRKLPRTHEPHKVGCGGVREKLDVEEMTPRSKKRFEKARARQKKYRMSKSGAIEKLSEAVLADPTEAWRTKVTGHVNKNPDRARQRAAADIAAALPKNPALHGPAVAAFMSHPIGKRAAASMQMEAPQDAAARRAAMDEKTVIPIPTHMFLSIVGFVMPTAPKPKKGKHLLYVKELPDDEYDMIQELMPEPMGGEYM